MFAGLRKFFKKKEESDLFRHASTEEVFTHIYLENKWGDEESRSGKGSNLEVTESLRVLTSRAKIGIQPNERFAVHLIFPCRFERMSKKQNT